RYSSIFQDCFSRWHATCLTVTPAARPMTYGPVLRELLPGFGEVNCALEAGSHSANRKSPAKTYAARSTASCHPGTLGFDWYAPCFKWDSCELPWRPLSGDSGVRPFNL